MSRGFFLRTNNVYNTGRKISTPLAAILALTELIEQSDGWRLMSQYR
jgi:hypothetical protein